MSTQPLTFEEITALLDVQLEVELGYILWLNIKMWRAFAFLYLAGFVDKTLNILTKMIKQVTSTKHIIRSAVKYGRPSI